MKSHQKTSPKKGTFEGFLLLLPLILFLPSCTMTLTGAGKLGIGYKSETMLFLIHETDGDKEGVSASTNLDIDPVLLSIIGPPPTPSQEAEEDTP